MDEFFGMVPLSNAAALCVGGISRAEAIEANERGVEADGRGYYLFLASQEDPHKPVEILAKFSSASAAEKLARLMPA
jgi:hypothetical protein